MTVSVLSLLVAGGILAGIYFMIAMPGSSHSGPLTPLQPTEIQLYDNLEKHVRTLASEIGERNLWRYPALEQTARYIETVFQDYGYTVNSQNYTAYDRASRNLEVELPGTVLPTEIIVVGAHYDTVPTSPGANDNGTGIAALLELSRMLANTRLAHTVRFVAFVNEEPPFFLTNDMGSFWYARRAKQKEENVVAMISLETLGFYSDEPRSQHYPFPFNFFYPDTGNFIAFVGNLSSRRLVRRSIASFRRSAAFPAEGVAAPGWIAGVDWSDHRSFWAHGYPAIMITDTAFYRYPYYHSSQDTPDKIDHERLTRVVDGLAGVVKRLAANGV